MSTDKSPEPITPSLARDFDSVESRLERHTLMATIATRFISVPAESTTTAILDTMAAIGRFADLDRVALALFDDQHERWSIDHDWHSPGLWSLQGLEEHVAPFKWGLPQILAGSPVEVLRPDYLPRMAANDALLMRGLGLGAALVIPVRRAGRVIGFVSAATTRIRDDPWPKAFYELLELPARMMVHALDRGVAEKRLRESQARWTSLCDSNVVGVLTARRSDGTVIESNDAGLRLLGCSREDMARDGIAWKDVTPPEEQPNDMRMLAILERSGRAMPWEKHALRPDGSRVPLLCSLASLAPQSDEMLLVAIDLSSRRRVAEELRRRDDIDRLHAELSRSLLDLTGERIEDAVKLALRDIAEKFGFDGVVVFDVDSAVETATRRSWWNRPAIGINEPEIRIPLRERAWWRERLRAGRTSYIADLEDLPESAVAEREALERFGIGSCVSVPLLPGGTLRGFILFFSGRRMEIADDLLATLRVFGDIVANAYERLRIDRDIAAAVSTLERRVELRRTQLEASNAELEAFAYSVSHDLRAPLRTIDGMCTVLREDWAAELGEEAVGLLGRIQAAAQRMGHLIDGLLLLSRVVRTEMEWVPVSITDLVEGIDEELKRRHAGRDIEVRVAPGLAMVGHPRLLRIAFEQLLDNAYKFTGQREGALVEVDAQTDAEKTVFHVRDNGVGFDPDFARKLFGAFQRLHGVEEFEGHGIGLATVERVARMHGGSAWAEGVPNAGATISLSFPHPPGTR
ncbi:MAG: ATP-binding protein [Candidatus Binatia bacterium]